MDLSKPTLHFNFIRLFLLIAVLGFICQLFLPWWSLAVVSFLAAWGLAFRAGSAFWAGFSGIGLGWLVVSLFFNFRNNGLLAAKVATLFKLPHAALLIFVTVLIGALIGGLAALSGYFFRKLFL
jgi:hypothetical protein